MALLSRGPVSLVSSVFTAMLAAGCSLVQPARPPIPLVTAVDLPRFMGDWYVIGFIPIFVERDAHNGIEHYDLRPDGSIATTYRFRDGSFDAPVEVHHPVGFVEPGTSNALWGMQFVWPFTSEYRIVHLEPDYSVTIVGRNARDYVWLMARTPEMSAADLARYRDLIAAMGYDLSRFKLQPQRWPEPPTS